MNCLLNSSWRPMQWLLKPWNIAYLQSLDVLSESCIGIRGHPVCFKKRLTRVIHESTLTDDIFLNFRYSLKPQYLRVPWTAGHKKAYNSSNAVLTTRKSSASDLDSSENFLGGVLTSYQWLETRLSNLSYIYISTMYPSIFPLAGCILYMVSSRYMSSFILSLAKTTEQIWHACICLLLLREKAYVTCRMIY